MVHVREDVCTCARDALPYRKRISTESQEQTIWLLQTLCTDHTDSQKNLKTFHTRGTRHKSSRYLSRVNSIMLQPGVRYHAFA